MMQFIHNLLSRKWPARTLMLGILEIIATGLALITNLSFFRESAVQAQMPTPDSSTPAQKPAYLDKYKELNPCDCVTV